MTSKPTWITTSGFLSTVTELTVANINLITSGTGVTYSLISGNLPGGLNINTTGTISGTADPVLNKTSSKFVIRAQNSYGVNDRTFILDVIGADNPNWVTPQGYLNIGPLGEYYAYNNQYVNFQLIAEPSESPARTELKYYIEDRAGSLPPSLSLSQSGKITGYVKDILAPNSLTSLIGGYDSDPYDNYFYDNNASFIGTDSKIVGVPKIYPFKVTVTDGVTKTTGTFSIVVTTVDILKYNPERMPADINSSTFSSTNYIQPIQLLSNTNLGILRSNNYADLDLSYYDPAPLAGTIIYSVVTGTSTFLNPPQYLKLDSNSGSLYGYIPYQPAYEQNYSFLVTATKIENTTGNKFTVTNTWTVAVKGEVESTVEWLTDSYLGTIETGIVSELSVKAKELKSDYSIKYNLVSGLLPQGLNLGRDGSIYGRASYGSTGTYTFTILASDVYELSSISKEFSLNVIEENNKQYTEIYCKPLLPQNQKDYWNNFISDTFTFDPKLIYRFTDPNFGVQQTLKIILEFGIERLNLEDYVSSLAYNFYRKNLYFGKIKKALGRDSNNNILYEVVYVDIIDNLVNDQNTSTGLSIDINNTTYYPNSIDNMRTRLSQIILPDNNDISINDKFLPKFMSNYQDVVGISTGYLRVFPICYALPGNGSKIISRIKLSKFDFSKINFEIDRLIVRNSADYQTERYLLFPRQNISK